MCNKTSTDFVDRCGSWVSCARVTKTACRLRPVSIQTHHLLLRSRQPSTTVRSKPCRIDNGPDPNKAHTYAIHFDHRCGRMAEAIAFLPDTDEKRLHHVVCCVSVSFFLLALGFGGEKVKFKINLSTSTVHFVHR